jgi:hypothetical protein
MTCLISYKPPTEDDEEMQEEYDFSGGVRGKHVRAYRAGHSVRIAGEDGIVEERHFTLADGAVMLDPGLRAQFPDSDAVNKALRSLTSRK